MAVAVGELQRCVALPCVNSGSKVFCSVDNAPWQRVRCQSGNAQVDFAPRKLLKEFSRSEARPQQCRFLWKSELRCRKRIVLRAGPDATAESAAAEAVKPKGRYPGEKKGFVEEMRFVAMKLHTKDQSKEGEREAQTPVAQWRPTINGYIQFLVDSKAVYDTMEAMMEEAADPSYVGFRNTGLERSAALKQDLEWFRSEGHHIPEPSPAGRDYANYLLKLAKEDPPAFICHYYNVYFAHTAGGRFIGKKVAEDILNGRTLEFYKWHGDVKEHLAAVRETLNKVAEGWTRESKTRCLQETELSFSYSGKLLRLIASPQ